MSRSFVRPEGEETTKSKGGHFANLKRFSVVKSRFLWGGLNVRETMTSWWLISAAYAGVENHFKNN